MDIELLTIGTELLLGFTIDTNAAELGQSLAAAGVRVVRHTSVADDPTHIADALRDALARSGTVITTGGLGPTRDDISREVVAGVMGMPLTFDPSVWAALVERYRRLGRDLPESNRAQAMVPSGAQVLPNRWGTAPGLWLESSCGRVIMLPGVPLEMRMLLQHEVLPRLAALSSEGELVIRSRMLRTSGIAESTLAECIGAFEETIAPLTLAYLPQTAGVDLRVTAWLMAPDEAERRLAEAIDRLRPMVEQWCYGEDDADLAGEVLQLLRARSLTLALAESCTGGMLATQLTAVPGSSDVFLGGVVCYADSAKHDLLAVPTRTLQEFGAVSGETAAAMASGAVQAFGADVGISITGIAGPMGGSESKPVGTTWIGFHLGNAVDQVKVVFPGTRHEIRQRAVAAALGGLRGRLLQ